MNGEIKLDETKDKAIEKIDAPKLVRIGKREISLAGWNQPGARAHLNTHLGEPKPEARWCSPECAARTFFDRATAANVQKVRKKISGLYRSLLEQGLFLIVRYDETPSGRGRILGFRIYNPAEMDDYARGVARRQLERRLQRNEVNEAGYQKALAMLEILPPAPVT